MALKKQKLLVNGPDEWGSVYVYFRQHKSKSAVGKPLKTVPHKIEVNVDYDANGVLFGVELLGIHARLNSSSR